MNDLRTRADEFEPLSVDRFIAGALQPADWTTKAHRVRRLYRDKVNALFKDWDILLTAATPVNATVIGTEWLDINGTQHPARAAMGLLTQPISFADCPVVAAPMWPADTGGMPLGVQIIAAPWREDLAFCAAPVRQALFRLQQEGFVEVLFRSGWRVLPFDFDQFEELYDLRMVIETTAARRLCEDAAKVNSALLDELAAIWLIAPEQRSSDAAQVAKWDEAFHCAQVATAGNAEMGLKTCEKHFLSGKWPADR